MGVAGGYGIRVVSLVVPHPRRAPVAPPSLGSPTPPDTGLQDGRDFLPRLFAMARTEKRGRVAGAAALGTGVVDGWKVGGSGGV